MKQDYTLCVLYVVTNPESYTSLLAGLLSRADRDRRDVAQHRRWFHELDICFKNNEVYVRLVNFRCKGIQCYAYRLVSYKRFSEKTTIKISFRAA